MNSRSRALKKPTTPNPAPLSLNEEAYRRIEEMIVTLELAPGSVVSEAMLSARIGIGHTPIREALQRLSREHLVQILPRRGVVVTAIDVSQQLQILETRRELDRLIARSAAARATQPEREAMTAIAQAMESAVKSGDFVTFLRCDNDMNRQAALSARNSVAAAAVAALHSASRRFWFYHHQGQANTTLRLHVALARALASGKPEKAAEASDRLIDDLFDFARGTLISRT